MSAKTDNLFEKKLARLQEIVAALESGDLPLEKGMALYKKARDVRGTVDSSSTRRDTNWKSGRTARPAP